MNLCLATKWRPVPRVTMQWWEQDGLDLGGGSDGGQRAGADGGGEETDDVETAKDNQ